MARPQTKATTIANLVLALQKSENALNAACEARDELMKDRDFVMERLEEAQKERDAAGQELAVVQRLLTMARRERDEALARVEYLEKERHVQALAKAAKQTWEREARERDEREATESAVREV